MSRARGARPPRRRSSARSEPSPPTPRTARAVAVDVVRRVVDEGAYSNLTLRRTLHRASLSPQDAALATELSYGTVRRRIALDHALGPLLERPLDTAPKAARALLRVGAYQILFTRIPPHAAVSETVALADARHRGFVNAVLRRLSTTEVRWPAPGTAEATAISTGLAPWAVAELERLVGDERDAAAAALAEPAATTLRVNRCRSTLEDLASRLADSGATVTPGSLHADSLVLSGGAPERLPGFDEGAFTVQDQASSFVVSVLDPQPGDRVLDACAGPGGKAGDIACRVGPRGRLVAADISVPRAGLVRSTLARLGLEGDVVVQDARARGLDATFDRILVDAPCSGLGSARRRPELLWRATRDELSALARLQVAIVEGITPVLRPGGLLVYSVCTFPRAETDAACDAIVRHRPDLEPAEIDGPDGRSARIRLWPHRHGSDAMFVAAFRRRA
jgi:16S rRNA (cytosine967-C5)-methyltransferase